MNRIGANWLVLWSSPNKVIEIGFGNNYSFTNAVFQTKTYKFLCFWMNVSRPTLKYMFETRKIKGSINE